MGTKLLESESESPTEMAAGDKKCPASQLRGDMK